MLWLLLSLLAAVFRGIGDVLRKQALRTENLTDFITAFAVMQFVLGLPILFFGVEFQINFSIIVLIALSIIFAIIGAFFTNATYKNEEISTAAPLFNFSPAILLVLSFFLLGEMPKMVQIIGIGIIIFGGYFLTIKNFRSWHHPFTEIKKKHLFFMLMVWITASFMAILSKVILENITSYSFFFWNKLFFAVISLIIALFAKRIKNVLQSLKSQFFVLIIPAILVNFTSLSIMWAIAIPTALVSLIIPILRVSTVITVGVGGRVCHEKHVLHKLLASLIMLGGVFLIALG